MKKLWAGLGFVLFLTFGTDAVAVPLTVQITTDKKRVSLTKPIGSGEGTEAKGTEKLTFDIKLENRAASDLSGLTVDYIVFVERQKLGEKKSADSVVRLPGSRKVEALTKQTPQTVTSDEIALITESVVGNYIFPNGGRIRAEDSIKGIWVRVSQNGQVIGESIMPASIKTRGWQ